MFINTILRSISLLVAYRTCALAQSDEEINFKASAPTRSVPVNFTNIGPIAISLEFFAFPDYMTTVPNTAGCIRNLADAIGTQIPVRIGGTTGDFGAYDPNLKEAIHYTLSAADKGVPKTLTYGPEFIRLASTLPGPVTLGLNCKANNLPNSLLAAQEAVKQIKNIHALELGNEPECKSTPALNPVGRNSIIQAGNYLQKFRIADLAKAEQTSAVYVKSFGVHSYPQFACGGKPDLRSLMSHSSIVDYMNHFKPDIQAAADLQKDVYFSETNSGRQISTIFTRSQAIHMLISYLNPRLLVACGGAGISPTFGAALWTLDYIIQALLSGIQSLYFHHGTLGNSES
ncbi:family 79 glycoside hydrolase [Melampsora larici-populina 98AG31]|uniref:Family 79 glycoside hydrolase n=1 Tax=Melampsora larici-populina (strain 98AG31 / pathotype 3-4-7) TaxID=747676 RepID=F4SA39_MELLP|nr:family 79 glycoside hydrolase [Melampsora larici-populina 98AG31]EGF98482.1 family 79 glycoside hydrolase [Melampsora larici-populina 98AG31]